MRQLILHYVRWPVGGMAAGAIGGGIAVVSRNRNIAEQLDLDISGISGHSLIPLHATHRTQHLLGSKLKARNPYYLGLKSSYSMVSPFGFQGCDGGVTEDPSAAQCVRLLAFVLFH